MPIRRPLLALLIVLTVAGCKRPAPPVAINAPVPPEPTGEFTLLATLQAGKRTHVALDSRGAYYWVQETSDSRDSISSGAPGQSPRFDRLLTKTILNLLGSPTGTGNIQSIVCGVDDRVYFYFAGNDPHRSLACLGVYDPARDKVRIIAFGDDLARASGLGPSLDLARGSFLPAPGAIVATTDPLFSPDALWLWLRHSDQGVIVRIDPRAAWNTGHAGLRCIVNQVQMGTSYLKINSPDDVMTLGPNRTFFYLDHGTGSLWKLTAPWLPAVATGNDRCIATAAEAQHLNDAPNSLTPPAFDEKENLFLLAGDSPAMAPTENGAPTPLLAVIWPAMLVIDAEGKMQTIDRDHLVFPSVIAPEDLQPTCLIPDRHNGIWLVYDRATGALLRLKISLRQGS